MKRLPRLALAAALFAGALAGIPSLAFAGNLPAAIDGSVAVMHTNDIHGSYKYSYNASKGTGTVGFDGLAVLYSAQNSAPDLLLDAGDTFHGQSFATMSEGKSIAELMDTFYVDGYDATTPGNHELRRRQTPHHDRLQHHRHALRHALREREVHERRMEFEHHEDARSHLGGYRGSLHIRLQNQGRRRGCHG